jgi:hypothetical protein
MLGSVYPALFLAFEAIAILVLVVTSDSRHDFLGRPLGTDFAQVWIAEARRWAAIPSSRSISPAILPSSACSSESVPLATPSLPVGMHFADDYAAERPERIEA